MYVRMYVCTYVCMYIVCIYIYIYSSYKHHTTSMSTCQVSEINQEKITIQKGPILYLDRLSIIGNVSLISVICILIKINYNMQGA